MLTVNGSCEDQLEREPLLQRPTEVRRKGAVLRLSLLLCICLLERCTFYECVADVLNSRPSKNAKYCGILGDNSTVDFCQSDQPGVPPFLNSQILLGLASLLPLLGGFAADYHFGCRRVLVAGCVTYCLGAWLMMGLEYVKAFCSDALKYVCQSVLAIGVSLIRPSLMVMSYELGQPVLGDTGLCHLYYAFESIGQILGGSLSYYSDIIVRPVTYVCIPITHIMLGLALFALCAPDRSGWDPSQFMRPTWPTVRRILIIVWPIILLASVLMLAEFTFSGWELTWLTSPSRPDLADLIENSDLLQLVWAVALLASVAALSFLTRRVATLRPTTNRIAIGIVVIVVNQIISLGLDLGLNGTNLPADALTLTKFAFGAQAVLNAMAEALTFIAANEIAFEIASVEMRTFIIGLFMSLRGSGFFTSIVTLLGFCQVKDINIELGGIAFFHLGMGAALTIALLFFLCLAPNALRWLVDVKEADSRRLAREQQVEQASDY